MPSEWEYAQLGDVARLTTGYPFKSQHYTDDVNAPRLIGGDNIVQGALRWDSIRRWPRDMTDGLDDYWLEPGDVVLAMDRPWIEAGLKRAAVGSQDVPSLLVQRTARLRGSVGLDTAFLRYVVGSQAFTHYILSVQTGTAVPHISPAQIRAYRFPLPPLGEQRAIAETLGALDNRIEHNRVLTANLESIARALFKSWFVDFDPVLAKAAGETPAGLAPDLAALFPARFVESELGEIPEGWRTMPISGIAGLDTSSVKPFEEGDTEWIHFSIPAFDSGRYPARETGQQIASNKYRVSPGSILVSKLNPSQWRCWRPPSDLVTGKSICSTEFMQFVSLRNQPEFVWGLCQSAPFRDLVMATVDGTTGSRQRAKPKDVARGLTLFPSDSLAAAFCGMARPLLQRADAAILEARALAELRDLLLPRLISGKLRVEDAVAAMEAA